MYKVGKNQNSYSLDTCDQVGKNEAKKREIRLTLAQSFKEIGDYKSAEAITACHEVFRVEYCPDCRKPYAFPVSCSNRLCPECAERRAMIMIKEHGEMLDKINHPKFLTLTFLSVKNLSKEYIKYCRNSFQKLRDRKIFESCWGGIYSFEVTWHEKTGWHVHLHAVLGSGYIDQKELSKEWRDITGAHRVWIEAVKGDKKAAIKEIIKYPAKAVNFIGKPNIVKEYLDVMKGLNLAYGFGALYRVRSKTSTGEKAKCPYGHELLFDCGYGYYLDRDKVVKIKGGWDLRDPPI